MRFPTWIKFLAVFLFATFAWVSLSENFVHHHLTQTEEQDCAYCQFHKTISSSDFFVEPYQLIPLFLILAVVFSLTLSPFQTILVERPGRAPPKNLL